MYKRFFNSDKLLLYNKNRIYQICNTFNYFIFSSGKFLQTDKKIQYSMELPFLLIIFLNISHCYMSNYGKQTKFTKLTTCPLFISDFKQ